MRYMYILCIYVIYFYVYYLAVTCCLNLLFEYFCWITLWLKIMY